MASRLLQKTQSLLVGQARRNFGVSAVVMQKADPIQQLFLDKIREYAKKSQSAAGGLVDATPDVQKSLKDSLDKIDGAYQVKGQDFTKFPSFNFTDSPLEPIGLGRVEIKSESAGEEVADTEARDPEKAYFEY